jgi:hypothetical protein
MRSQVDKQFVPEDDPVVNIGVFFITLLMGWAFFA